MPTVAANTPASWAGNCSPRVLKVNSSQVAMPQTTEKIAPWVLAFFQYRPNTSGMNAPTRGTW
ncbi:hypothetical protein D3C87_2086210 [compost metagenome]